MKGSADDWVMLPAPNQPPQSSQPPPPAEQPDDMLRLVTAVSEVMAVLGNTSRFKLGEVSAAVRRFDCDSALAIEYLLAQPAAPSSNSGPAPPAPAVQQPQPSAPPAAAVGLPPASNDKLRCPFCEVLNPTANVKCFVCDTSLANAQPSSSSSNSNNNAPAPSPSPPPADGPRSYKDMQIPASMVGDDVDLTQSTELAIKKVLWEEEQEKERQRKKEEELTQQYLKAESARRQRELDAKTYECEICFGDCKIEEMYTLEECFHRFCRECITYHCKSNIVDGNTRDIACPSVGCPHKISYPEVRQVVDAATMAKYEAFLLKATLGDDQSVVWCPKPGCEMAMFVQGGLMLICPAENCRFTFCRQCKVEWHTDSSCEQYQEWRKENSNADNLYEIWRAKHTKPCPKCRVDIEKWTGCNHMTCKNCKQEFCWLCGEEYKRGHFNSSNPKGCKQFS